MDTHVDVHMDMHTDMDMHMHICTHTAVHLPQVITSVSSWVGFTLAAERERSNATAPPPDMLPPVSPPPGSPPAQSSLWLFGLCIAICSNALSTIGLLVQKISTDLEKGKPLHKKWRYWIGLAINLGSEITLTPIAMSFTPISLLAPTSGVGIVTGTLIAGTGCLPGLKEHVSLGEAASTGLVVAGVVLASVCGPRGDGEPSLETSLISSLASSSSS